MSLPPSSGRSSPAEQEKSVLLLPPQSLSPPTGDMARSKRGCPRRDGRSMMERCALYALSKRGREEEEGVGCTSPRLSSSALSSDKLFRPPGLHGDGGSLDDKLHGLDTVVGKAGATARSCHPRPDHALPLPGAPRHCPGSNTGSKGVWHPVQCTSPSSEGRPVTPCRIARWWKEQQNAPLLPLPEGGGSRSPRPYQRREEGEEHH